MAEVGLRWWRHDAAVNRMEDLDVQVCKISICEEVSDCAICNARCCP